MAKATSIELYNKRFEMFGYKIITIRSVDNGYQHLLSLLQLSAVINMSSSTTYVNDKETASDVLRCGVIGQESSTNCRIGIGGDGSIYLIVWDPSFLERKCGMKYFREMMQNHKTDEIHLFAIDCSKLRY
jgi:hypothetical protein